MRQAIQTKWFGPTNTKPSRIKAEADAGHIWHSWDYSLNVHENHTVAAKKLKQKFGWPGNLVGGELADCSCVFVFVEDV